MKIIVRTLSITLILSLLLCMSVFAYNRTVYKKTSKRYWMKAIGKDKNPDGSEDAYASARLDIDYPGENGKDHNLSAGCGTFRSANCQFAPHMHNLKADVHFC